MFWKIFSPTVVFTCVLLLSSFQASSQEAKNNFVNDAGRFGVGTADQPTEIKESRFSLSKYQLDGKSFVWRFPGGGFASVDYYEVTGDDFQLKPPDRNNVVQDYRKSLLDEMQKASMMTAESPFTYDGFRGLEVRGIKQGKLIVRFFFSNGRFYILSAVGPDFDAYDHNLALLETFRTLSKSEYTALLIEHNAPASLPQESRKTRPMSDAVEDDLKGAVKSVITDSQELPKKAKERSSEEYYDVFGDRIKTIYYMNGYPTEVSVCGWIDGMRVDDQNEIDYGPADGPNENGVVMLTAAIDPEYDKKPHPPRDDRFSYRYEYKYDPKSREIERSMFQNDGSLWQRSVFKYLVGKREETIYDEDGKLNMRTVFVLDKSGNVTEEIRYDNKGKTDSDTTYKFELDVHGNWIVRRSFTKKSSKGSVVLVPAEVESRSISYY